ncbi:MAG: hypothetical protein JO294_15640 [Alphaproteobacteria bacterium]|nr:hypothetical protein [Alphaproteobacteria bacterium]
MSTPDPTLDGAVPLLNALDGINYVTSRDGTILAAGAANWHDFAGQNDGHRLAGPVGLNCLSACSDGETRDAYSTLYEKLWSGDLPRCALRVRCDSPGLKRVMRLVLAPLHFGGQTKGIVHQSLLVHETQRPAVDLFREYYRHTTAWTGPLLKMCSYCQKVHMSGDHWVEAEDYYRLGGSSDVRISHGICEPCADSLLKLLEIDKNQGKGHA